MAPTTDKIMELLLAELRELSARVLALDVKTAALVAEVRATKTSDEKAMAVLTKDVEGLKLAVDQLKEANHRQDIAQVKLTEKVAFPASIAALATGIGALLKAFWNH